MMASNAPSPRSRTAPARKPFLETLLAGGADDRPPAGPSWLGGLRRDAIERLAGAEFPTTKDEAWRFTSLASLESIPLRLDPGEGGEAVHGAGEGAGLEALLSEVCRGLEGAPRLAFVNGRYAAGLSSPAGLPGGVRLSPLSKAFNEHRASLEPHLGRCAPSENGPFADLNTAFARDGALLVVPDGVAVEEPILLAFLSTPRGEPFLHQPRILVVAGGRSQAAVIEAHAGPDGCVYSTNAVTEISAAGGAVVEHFRIQREGDQAFHIAALQARLGAGAAFTAHSVALGGGLSRSDVTAILDGEGAECTLNGLYVATGGQHVDNHTTIDHARPHGSSRELYKGILDGTARGVFDGKIVVRPDAQKTDARQTNRNLLLSDGALINTKPQLEIRADDVKCAHAATIGRLDEAALFYLRSRGLGLEAARALLIRAFAGEVLGAIRAGAFRESIERTVFARLFGGRTVQEAA